MKPVLRLLIFVVIAVGSNNFAWAQTKNVIAPATGVVTLFALDPLLQSLCFKDGGPGGAFESGAVRNRCSDLNFHSYTPNGFSVGVEGGREGVIVNLGTPEGLRAKYGFTETVGNGQGFASITVKNRKALILKDYKTGALQELTESTQLFQASPKPNVSLPVRSGHVYLLRITDRHDKAFEVFAKILVLGHVPNESVTIRWHMLSSDAAARL